MDALKKELEIIARSEKVLINGGGMAEIDIINFVVDYIKLYVKHNIQHDGEVKPVLMSLHDNLKGVEERLSKSLHLKKESEEQFKKNVDMFKYNISALPLHEAKTKEDMLIGMVRFIQEAKPWIVIHVSEGYRIKISKNKELTELEKGIMSGDVKVSELPSEMKEEVVMMSCENCKDKTERQITFIINRDSDGKPSIDIRLGELSNKADDELLDSGWQKMDPERVKEGLFSGLSLKAEMMKESEAETIKKTSDLINDFLKD
jgi:preprotein translocase subunit YajC